MKIQKGNRINKINSTVAADATLVDNAVVVDVSLVQRIKGPVY